jgi:hypothetical protein
LIAVADEIRHRRRDIGAELPFGLTAYSNALTFDGLP